MSSRAAVATARRPTPERGCRCLASLIGGCQPILPGPRARMVVVAVSRASRSATVAAPGARSQGRCQNVTRYSGPSGTRSPRAVDVTMLTF
jgi:hypothetical protein